MLNFLELYNIHGDLGLSEQVELEEPLYPRIYVCPWCAVVWGIIDFDGRTDEAHVQGASCEVCNEDSYWYPVPGSLLSVKLLPGGWDVDLLKILPAKLVEREFLLHLKAVRGIPDDDK